MSSIPPTPPAMAAPALFAMEDGSTMAVTLDQDLDDDEEIEVVGPMLAPDLLTAVMRIHFANRLYRISFNTSTLCEVYLVRLEDNSILINTGNYRIISNWVAIDSENVISHRPGISMPSKLTFKHLTELEYTFS